MLKLKQLFFNQLALKMDYIIGFPPSL